MKDFTPEISSIKYKKDNKLNSEFRFLKAFNTFQVKSSHLYLSRVASSALGW